MPAYPSCCCPNTLQFAWYRRGIQSSLLQSQSPLWRASQSSWIWHYLQNSRRLSSPLNSLQCRLQCQLQSPYPAQRGLKFPRLAQGGPQILIPTLLGLCWSRPALHRLLSLRWSPPALHRLLSLLPLCWSQPAPLLQSPLQCPILLSALQCPLLLSAPQTPSWHLKSWISPRRFFLGGGGIYPWS